MEATFNWKKEFITTFEKMRSDFVNNDSYRGLDLNFKTLFQMATGLSDSTFEEINNLAITSIEL